MKITKKTRKRKKVKEKKNERWDSKFIEVDIYIRRKQCSKSWKFINRVKAIDKTTQFN